MTTTARKPGSSRGKPNLDLLKRRMQMQMSRGQLARMSGISEKQVGLIERGMARAPRMETMAAIAAALEVDDLTEIFDPHKRYFG